MMLPWCPELTTMCGDVGCGGLVVKVWRMAGCIQSIEAKDRHDHQERCRRRDKDLMNPLMPSLFHSHRPSPFSQNQKSST